MPETVLVLFPNAWDRVQFGHDKYRGEIEFLFHGEDLFSFPGNVKLLTFDAVGFVAEVCERFGDRITGVLSTDEYVGAILAAAVAKRLGLPGNDPAAIITAQHKFYSRVTQRAVCPDAVPEAVLVPLSGLVEDDIGLSFPFFVKPVKGTFSLFAAKVDDFDGLKQHMGFNVFERLLLGRITRPFNELLRAYTELEHDADYFVGEGLMQGDQVTVDAFCHDGEVHVMGVVDSVMFPGTMIFERFEYPSRHHPRIQRRMVDATVALMKGLGITDGQWNVEFFYDRVSDEVKIIEVNPRLSYQFADLYEYIDGSNTYDVLLDLTLGRRPTYTQGAGEWACSASFVMRTFDGKRLLREPSEDEVAAFNARYADSTIKIYGKTGDSMKSEMKAIGSYRWAIFNTAAQSMIDLFAINEDALETLPFETH